MADGKGYQAGLVHAQVVHAMDDHDRRSMGMVHRGVHARPHGAAGEREGKLGGGDGVGDQPAQRRGDGLIADAIQDRDRLQPRPERGPARHCIGRQEYGQACEQDLHIAARMRGDRPHGAGAEGAAREGNPERRWGWGMRGTRNRGGTGEDE